MSSVLVYSSNDDLEFCFYECGQVANTNDHIIPTEDGGANCRSNYVRACKTCNSSRNERPIAEFLAERGVEKEIPSGITDIEYKLTSFPIGRLSIFKCLWCERPFVSLRQPAGQPQPSTCSPNHRSKFKTHKRSRILETA